MMNEQEVLTAAEAHDILCANVRLVAIAVADIRKTLYKHPAKECYVGDNFEIAVSALDGWYPGQKTITAHFFESTCNCCSNEEYYVEFPLSYLWTENYVEVETEAHAERLRKAEHAAAEKARREAKTAAKKKEDTDRKTYEMLKKKYEPEES